MAGIKLVIFDKRWKATFTNAQEVLLLNALGKKYNYLATVPNPVFNPTLPVSPENSPNISNPIDKANFIATSIINEVLGAAKTRTLEEVKTTLVANAGTTAQSQVDSSFSNITVAVDV